MASRGQQSVLGSLLMVAIVVVLLATVAVSVFAFTDVLGPSAPTASLDPTIGDAAVSITHQAGDPVPVAETELVLDLPAATMRVPLSSMDGAAADGDGTLSAGDVYTYPHGVRDGDVTARVVHVPANAVVASVSERIRNGSVVATNWTGLSLSGYSGSQDGSGTVATIDGGRSLLVSGNRWLRIDHEYTVTEDTMVSFEFRSGARGDIHGIGLENDDVQSQDRIVRVYGTQNWGINVSSADAEYYPGDGAWKRYTVPIGELYAERNTLGQASNLVIVMDCDATTATASGTADGRCLSRTEAGDPAAVSQFRTVRVYETED